MEMIHQVDEEKKLLAKMYDWELDTDEQLLRVRGGDWDEILGATERERELWEGNEFGWADKGENEGTRMVFHNVRRFKAGIEGRMPTRLA